MNIENKIDKFLWTLELLTEDNAYISICYSDDIVFPENEIESLNKRLDNDFSIFTTRVEDDLNKYKVGTLVTSNLKYPLVVCDIKKIHDINDHIFYEYLTTDQINYLKKYDKLEILKLKRWVNE